MVKEDQLACRRSFVGQVIIKAIIRKSKEKFIGFERFIQESGGLLDGRDP